MDHSEREDRVMPKTTKQGNARQGELPSTLQRSDAKAQRTFAKDELVKAIDKENALMSAQARDS